MAISQAELNEMDKISGLSQTEFDDMDNIAMGENLQQPKNKGIDLTPSGIAKGVTDNVLSAAFAPYRANKDNITLTEAFNKNKSKVQNYRKQNPTPGKDMVLDTLAYSLIPQSKAVAPVARLASNVARYGTIPGVLEGLKNGNALGGAAIGTGLTAVLLGGVPVVGKVGKATVGKLKEGFPKALGVIAQLEPETVQQAIKPGSKALDYTKKSVKAKEGEMIEKIREGYDNLLSEKVNNVEKAIKNLRSSENRINADDLVNDITSTFDQYQGENINPAINMTGYLKGDLVDLIENGKPIVNINTADLPKYTGNKNQYNRQLRDLYFKNAKGSTIEHPETGDIYFPRNGAGEAISNLGQDYEQLNLIPQIKEITQNSKFQNIEDLIPGKNNRLNAKDFDVMRGRANVDGNIVDTDIKIANTPQGKMFYTNEKPFNGDPGFTSYGQPGDILGSNNIIADNEAYFNSLSPIDLQKAKQQIGHMINWQDEAAKNYKNPILEQIYGKFDKRLSDLSPELAQANKEYAALRDFQKSEGIRSILNQQNTDNAISKLKNYDSMSSVKKAENIKELEKLMVENGYDPFLSDVDDIVAAQDLLKKDFTGLGSAAGLAKAILTKPALRAMRNYNSSQLPAILSGTAEKIKPGLDWLGNVARRVVPAAAVSAPTLYGGLEYNVYQ